MKNWKTTTMGVITIALSVLTIAKNALESGTVPDLMAHVTAITAGWGLIVAKDNTARL
jgi:uncharacterized membrane protein HdeD (DUF308 family)